MAILLPIQYFSVAPNVGRSYYENLAGGINAAVTVQNDSANPVLLVLTRVDAPVITYEIAANNSLTLAVNLLLVAALLGGAGTAFGFVQVATAEF